VCGLEVKGGSRDSIFIDNNMNFILKHAQNSNNFKEVTRKEDIQRMAKRNQTSECLNLGSKMLSVLLSAI
jgi:hypothetical protein